MNKHKVVIFLFSLLLLISCNKNMSGKEAGELLLQNETEQTVSTQEEIEIPAPVGDKEIKQKLEPTEEDIVRDMDRFFLYEDCHPIKQTDFIKKVKERLNKQEKIYEDDSLYDDKFTVEFSLHDEEQNFCIYHNIRNVDGYSIDDYEIFKYVNTGRDEFVWSFQEKEGLSIEWVEETGVIVMFGTEDPRYATKRGIRVGDSAEKIMKAYEEDCTVQEYNYTDEKWETVSEKEYPCMLLSKSNEWISLNIGNDRAEGMMTISYLLENDVVTKIIIQGS
ncbi:MAG: hypothetical protein VZR56_05145 [Treponema sp.]|nr:hypothetical protein [Treponema sp.]